MDNHITAFNETESQLAALEADYSSIVYDVTDSDGMKDAKAAYKEINRHNIALEKCRKTEKSESLAYGKFVDTEAKRISARLDALRLPIKAVIDEEKNRIEAAHEAAVQAERERIEAEELAAKQAEEKRIADQQAEIDRQREELAEARRKQAEAEAESRRRIEDQEREARKKTESEARAAQEIIDKKNREIEAAAKAERDRVEAEERAERMKAEQAERQAREAKEKKEAARRATEAKAAEKSAKIERERVAAELKISNGYDMLDAFIQSYGGVDEFHNINQAILAFLAVDNE